MENLIIIFLEIEIKEYEFLVYYINIKIGGLVDWLVFLVDVV